MTKAGPDPYKAKRHKFYVDPLIIEGLDALAAANKREGKPGVTRSDVLARAALRLLRNNAARLREYGFDLPRGRFLK